MFNYQLAKKLRDGGFPQLIKYGGHFYNHNTSLSLEISLDEPIANRPSLSELIEACGEGLDTIFRIGECTDADGTVLFKKGWYARNGDDSINTVGSTPEESIAKLWLVLNQK